jgi:benzoyl-CoA reductase/2-hydroxyglutaryl-CoA dehydratase subunit BcrC/BadD/HgdB
MAGGAPCSGCTICARPNPVPISGKDALLVTQVSFYDDVTRHTQMVNALCDELDQRVKQVRGQGA